ncbi:hypothetical protein ACKVMT_05585 [Halobacteriales archaeon Cl-PHB]
MEDDTDIDGSPDRRPDGQDSKLDHSAAEAGRQERDSLSRAEWEQLPADPDPGENLGYDRVEWEQFTALDGTDQVMFLPADEDVLREDAFVVAEPDAVCDLEDRC